MFRWYYLYNSFRHCEGWHISNNIRLVLDILDYPVLFDDNSLILFLDFYKAFDTLEHPFMFEALRCFGFGKIFINIMKMLYTNIIFVSLICILLTVLMWKVLK